MSATGGPRGPVRAVTFRLRRTIAVTESVCSTVCFLRRAAGRLSQLPHAGADSRPRVSSAREKAHRAGSEGERQEGSASAPAPLPRQLLGRSGGKGPVGNRAGKPPKSPGGYREAAGLASELRARTAASAPPKRLRLSGGRTRTWVRNAAAELKTDRCLLLPSAPQLFV